MISFITVMKSPQAMSSPAIRAATVVSETVSVVVFIVLTLESKRIGWCLYDSCEAGDNQSPPVNSIVRFVTKTHIAQSFIIKRKMTDEGLIRGFRCSPI